MPHSPNEEQDQTADPVLEETVAERSWADRFARSGRMLAAFARRARAQYLNGETTAVIVPPDTRSPGRGQTFAGTSFDQIDERTGRVRDGRVGRAL
jgi:hypothetical protein